MEISEEHILIACDMIKDLGLEHIESGDLYYLLNVFADHAEIFTHNLSYWLPNWLPNERDYSANQFFPYYKTPVIKKLSEFFEFGMPGAWGVQYFCKTSFTDVKFRKVTIE